MTRLALLAFLALFGEDPRFFVRRMSRRPTPNPAVVLDDCKEGQQCQGRERSVLMKPFEQVNQYGPRAFFMRAADHFRNGSIASP